MLYRDLATIEEPILVAFDHDGVGVVPLDGRLADAEIELDAAPGAIASWSKQVPHLGDPVSATVGAHRFVGRLAGGGVDGVAIATADGVVIVRPEQLSGLTTRLRIVGPARDRTVPAIIRYRTTSMPWKADYLLIDRGDGTSTLRGAITVENQTGRRWPGAVISVVDSDAAEAGVAATWSRAHPLSLGAPRDLELERQRVEIDLRQARPVVKPTLTFDPVTSGRDRSDMTTDERYGLDAVDPRVDATLTLELPPATEWPLPAGVLQMLTVDPAGTVAWRGEVEVPIPGGDSKRTVAVILGAAADVTGKRVQTMFDVDYDRERMMEEFKVTLTNRRTTPVSVDAREHLYRGTCWTLVYYSTDEVAKEGPQQVRLPIVVPAGESRSIVYRVLYRMRTCPP